MADYTIGSFNTLSLNYRRDNEINKDFFKFAQIIEEENFDIVALQETLNKQSIEFIIRHLSYPDKWKYYWDQEAERLVKDGENNQLTKNQAKGFTFLWNTKRFEESSKDKLPQFEPVRGDIVRRPLVGRFIPVNGPFCEIRLINIHLCNPNEKKDKKLNEFKLISELHQRLYSKRYGNNRVAYTIVLGDYNIPLLYCHECETINQLSTTTFLGGENEKTTLISKEKYQEAIDNGEIPFIFASDYDHFSYNLNYFENHNIIVNMNRINTVEKYCSNDLIEHRKTLSDHVPIKIELTLR